MRFTRFAAAVFLTVLIGGAAAAQSPFSLIGIGGDIRQSDARVAGRGGWGLAESDSLNPSFHNIAGLTDLGRVALLYSGYADLTESETATSTRRTSTVRTPNLRVALPVGRRLTLTAGFQALRGTQYKTLVTGEEVVSGVFPDTLDFEQAYVREGTQFEVPLGFALQVMPDLSVGVSLNLVRGVVRENTSKVHVDLYEPNIKILEDDLTGVSTTLSALWQPAERFAIGATLTPSHRWDVTRTISMNAVAIQSVQEYEVELPATWGVGAQTGIGGRWRIGGEFEAQPFSQFEGDNGWETDMCDAWRVGFGIERRESWRRRGGLNNLPLRLGYSHSRWPFEVNGHTLDERRVSLGTGLTFRQNGGHMDIVLSYGWLGDMDDHGVQDRTWRVGVSMVGLEKWW